MKLFSGNHLAAMLFLAACAFTQTPELSAKGYTVTNLVSDIPGIAPTTDLNLKNSWGLTFDHHGNLVVADNGTSLATSYTTQGTILPFVINVPSDPTGVERNHSESAFLFSPMNKPAKFIFSTEDGTILAFNDAVDPNNAIVVADRSAQNAVYKGLALAKVGRNHFLYATDFHNAVVDVFDSSFNYLFSFTDSTIPSGYAPFNVANISDTLYVTYAKQLAPDNHDDQAGPGNGFIDIFELDGTFRKRLVSHGALNSPWGLALAPEGFGEFEGKLLVGNFGNGIINAYDARNGKFHGQLSNDNGVIVIPGLWAIRFNRFDFPKAKANNFRATTLFFASGPNCEADGLVGKITPGFFPDSSSSSSSSSSSWRPPKRDKR